MNPIKYIEQGLLSLNNIQGGTLDNIMNNDIGNTYGSQYKTIVNSTDFKKMVNECVEKNINQPEKIYKVVNNLCKYKFFDFMVDLYKIPLHIKTLSNYMVYILIGLGILIIIAIIILVKMIMN